MELKTISIEELKEYENNPRNNDNAVDAVAESIKQCGYASPIVVDEDMIILAGHTRLKALKMLGYKKVQCAIVSGMSEEQKKKYRILDNKTGELSEWDFDMLEKELEEVDFEGYDFGFKTEMDSFDETDLDDERVKESVIVSINCSTVADYEAIKEKLQNAADEVCATLAVKMA